MLKKNQSNYFQHPKTGIVIDMRQVFFCAVREDAHKINTLAEQVCHPRTGTKCLVKWINPDVTVDEEDLTINLMESQVLVVFVSPALLSFIRENGLPLEVRIMQKNKRPYFPLLTSSRIFEEYCKLDRPIHGVAMDDSEFSAKIKEQLSQFVLDENLVMKIQQKAIVNQIFMSYRKTDAVATQKLMRQLHDLPGFEPVSIWYDRFLTAGEEFNEEIYKAIDDSSAFVMSITPNIIGKRDDESDNFIVAKEYPYAKEQGAPIIPIKADSSVYKYNELVIAFPGLPLPKSFADAEETLRSTLPSLPKADEYDAERLYYLGRAYLSGYFFEQDISRAISLLERATTRESEFSIYSAHQLAELYNTGDMVGGINYRKEIKWRKKEAELSEKILGKEHSDTATIYNNIGLAHQKQGDYAEAMEFHQMALVVREKVLGKEHLGTTITYNNIAEIHREQGDYAKAMEFYLKALAVREKHLVKNHPDTASIYNNIGRNYESQGNYTKAMEFYQMTLSIREEILGKEHSETAVTYNNIATIYHRQGDYYRALEFCQRALAVEEKVLGYWHPNLAISYNNIAIIYYHLNDYAKAMEFSFVALEIREKVLGKEHPDTAISYNNIAEIYSIQGNYEEGFKWNTRALEIREKVFGKEHPNTAISYNNIAENYRIQGDYEKALKWNNRALGIREMTLGKEHPDTAITYHNIAAVYESQGNIDKAQEWYQKARAIT